MRDVYANVKDPVDVECVLTDGRKNGTDARP